MAEVLFCAGNKKHIFEVSNKAQALIFVFRHY